MPTTGGDAHRQRLAKLSSAKAVQIIGAALFEGGQKLENEAGRLLTAGSVSGKGHVVSQPGEAPNNDTGVLARNIETVQTKPLEVEVSSNAPYAVPLELGTSNMAARPYMAPARDATKADIVRGVEKAAKFVVERSGG